MAADRGAAARAVAVAPARVSDFPLGASAGVYGRQRIWPGASGTPAKKAEYMMPLASLAGVPSDASETFSDVF